MHVLVYLRLNLKNKILTRDYQLKLKLEPRKYVKCVHIIKCLKCAHFLPKIKCVFTCRTTMENLDVSQKVSWCSEKVTPYVVAGQLHHYQYRFSFIALTCTAYLYKFVVVRCIPGSPLPGCVDDV